MLQRADLLLEQLPVEEIMNADTATGSLGAVSWADTLTGGTDRSAAEFLLLKAIDELVEVEHDVGTVRDEDAVGRVEALLLDSLELCEERGDVDDAAGADEVEAVGVHEACCCR